MNTLQRIAFSLTAAAAVLMLSSCDKVWSLGQKLKASDEPEVVLQAADNSKKAPVPVPILDDLDGPYIQKGAEVQPTEEVAAEEPKVNRDAEVSILGYHDFTNGGSSNDMILSVSTFREQMEALKTNEIPVIPMSDYVAWKNGEKIIPDPCVVLTFDDGWESVYTKAFPVMKAYGYPFSIYLYKNYVDIGGRSMTWEQIKEMMRYGCEVGSHSVSHSDMARRGGKSDEEYENWLREELGESMRFLRENLGDDVIPVFAYPYGKYNQEVVDLAKDYGYEVGITVAPKKASYTLSDYEVGRYIVHQTNDINFGYALRFRGDETLADSNNLVSSKNSGSGAEEESLVSLTPGVDETIGSRMPLIQADISRLEDVVASTITMEVSGYGKVPFSYDSNSGVVSYQMRENLRSETCRVLVTLKRVGESKTDRIAWTFQIDRKSLYLEEPTLKATPILSTGDAAVLDPSA